MVAYDPGLTAYEGVLETLTYHLVETEQVVIGKTLAVGRVGYYHGAFLDRLKVLEVTLLELYHVKQAGGLGVALGCQYGLGVLVVTLDAELELTLGRVIVVYLLKESSIAMTGHTTTRLATN